MKQATHGFTLIEVLVVMVIIGILVSILLPNVVGLRNRARDNRIKSELSQLKTALQMYYSDFQKFPEAGTDANSGLMMGCGDDGTEACGWGGRFSVTVDGQEKIYMEQLPQVNAAGGAITYTQPSGDQTYLIGVSLENASDGDIEESQVRCGVTVTNPPTVIYYVCP